MAILSVTLLGRLRVALPGQGEPRLRSPRGLMLLAYLALRAPGRVRRAEVAFRFWPDSSESQAHTNLRKLIYTLRAELPRAAEILEVDGTFLGLRPGALELDSAAFEGSLRQANRARRAGDAAAEQYALEAAAEAYRGDLMPGFYEEWVLEERERLQGAVVGALQRLARLLEARHAYREALQALQQLQAIDPLIEETYRQMMRLYAQIGDRAAALRTYRRCVETLERLLGVTPDPLTEKAHEQLLKQESAPLAPGPVTLDGTVRLVGRGREWAALQACWQRARSGSPHMVVISGEAGIGKTRLIEELLEWARQHGLETAATACYEAEGELPLTPLATWLRARPLPALEACWLAEIAAFLPDLAAGRLPALAAPQRSETGKRARLFEALARAALAGRSALILVLDDLHWCDSDTLEWLRYLLRFEARARLLVVTSLRPEECRPGSPAGRLLQALQRTDQLSVIELEAFNELETAELCSRLAHGAIRAEQARRVYQETEGNALFIVETLRAGLPAGLPESGPLAPRLHTLISSRLARLSPPARDLAGLASVLGRVFSADFLRAASGFDEMVLVQALEELLERRILREMPAETGVAVCDFTHDKIREVASAGLSAMRRKLFHRRAAEALEALYAGGLDPFRAQIALHYDRAGLPERAAHHRRQIKPGKRSA